MAGRAADADARQEFANRIERRHHRLMLRVSESPLPDAALLARYRRREREPGASAYVDCFRTRVDTAVTIGEFVASFYQTRLFRLERFVLARAAGFESTDRDAVAVAEGSAERFAAWQVEARAPNELLLADLSGRTRSWFRVEASGSGTALYFGSAVLPVVDRETGEARRMRAFRWLLGFHRVYSVLLLAAARRKLAA